MSKPMTATEIITALKKFNVEYTEHSGWRTRGRPKNIGAFENINGIIVHHTASNGSAESQVNLLTNGYSRLPGPLAQFGPDSDGVIHLIATGRCNHAGATGANLLDAVIAEDYDKYPPRGEGKGIDGNARFYGIEMMNNGVDKPTKKQYDATVKLCAAILDHYGWNAKSVVGHKESAVPNGRKIDPIFDMAKFRTDVQNTLDNTNTVKTQAGEEKKISATKPRKAGNAKPIPRPAPRPHVVKHGETLSAIAEKYGMTWRELHKLNREEIGTNPNILYPGQKLRLG